MPITVIKKEFAPLKPGRDDQARIAAALASNEIVELAPGTFSIGSVIGIPSNRWLLGSGPSTIIKNTSVAANRMLQNENFTTTGSLGGSDDNIHISNLILDANGDGTLLNNHTIYMTSVDGLIIEDIECINGGNFAGSIYRCKNVKVVNWHAESGSTGGLDGLHFWDSSDVEAVNISGSTGDDVVAVSSNALDVENVIVTNVRGTSGTANVARIGPETGRVMDNVKVLGIVADGAGARGIAITADGTLTNSEMEGVCKSSTLQGVAATGSGTLRNVKIKANVTGAAAQAALLDGPTFNHCEFDVMFYDIADGNQGIKLDGANYCTLRVNGDYNNTAGKTNEQAAVWLDSGTGNEITGRIQDGLRNIQLGSAGGPTETQIHDCVLIGALGNAIDEQGNSDSNFIYDNLILSPGGTAIDLVGGGSWARRNIGWVTENSDTGSIANGTSSDVITHGLDVTPTIDQIIITLAENPTNTPGAVWVDAIDSTNFTVHCENDPGASGLDFGWRVVT